MEFKVLMRPEVLERAKRIWSEHPSWAKDKRKRWALALGRIRKLLMEVREEDKRSCEDRKTMEDRVEAARLRIQHDHSASAREEFEEGWFGRAGEAMQKLSLGLERGGKSQTRSYCVGETGTREEKRGNRLDQF
ncbi:hypothetical protein R1sor_013713 [Riccia sorocarpa]|uniref:Uncharacterized protein n=1 Tax=Riccia sorocarpa TaxID=122646 RepID=A0ABD3HA82_9MARC